MVDPLKEDWFSEELRKACSALKRRVEFEYGCLPLASHSAIRLAASQSNKAATGSTAALPHAEGTAARDDPLLSLPSDLLVLEEIVKSCKRCRLHETRTHTVFGEGPTHCDVMFVGEGPGAEEDAVGRPFVGPAGKLLDRMIAAMGMKRQECYISNVVKCRPPMNATPKPDEAGACFPYLKKQIELVRPRILVALGRSAALVLTGKADAVSRLRGSWYYFSVPSEGQCAAENNGDIPVLVTYHPAALLRNPDLKPQAWQDLKLVLARLGRPVPRPGG